MNDLLMQQCEYVGKQLRAAVRGMSAEGLEARICATAMTPREIIEHLCDVYQYIDVKAKGGDAQWKQYAAPAEILSLMADFDRLRGEAIESCMNSEKSAELLTDYIIVHDAYHVGQLCMARISAEPAWNPYEIYE